MEEIRPYPGYQMLLKALSRKINSGGLKPRQISNVLWAFGKLGETAEGTDLIDRLIVAAEEVRMQHTLLPLSQRPCICSMLPVETRCCV